MRNKVVLITGASRGIGRETARLLAAKGYTVIVNYRKSQEAADALVDELRASGADACAMQADVSDFEQVSAMVAAIVRSYGHIDALVNNAGVALQKVLGDVSVEEWRHMMAVNLDGVFYACKCVLPHMISAQSGRIVNISSMWGEVGASCEVPYSAAKAGVIGFTKALAKEVGLSGITVNCITPGGIDTDMCASLDAQTKAALAEETPLGRIGDPDDVARAALFLASDNASFITGEVINVSGGFVI